MITRAWLSAIRVKGAATAAAAATLLAAAVLPVSASAADKVISTQSAGQPQPGQTVTSTSGAGPAAKVTGTSDANPGGADTDQVAALFSQRFPDLTVTAVRRTPYGLYEVQVGMDLIYTDAKVGWVMEGPLIDAATRQDVTRERQERIGAISFDQLPLNLAVKRVSGDGSRVVAVFEDPNCGYCKQLRHTLEDIPNLTVYTFIYPILAPDSRTKARDIWCAQKPGQAWDDWMVRGKLPAAANCNAPIDQVLALGQRLMVRGTPTLFFPDGSRVSGALPQDELLAHLDKSSKKGG